MRILVAEDDASLAEFLHQRLEQEQSAVQVVSHGAEAQQLASHQPYDLVILDLNLPGAGGLDVLRAGGNRDGRQHGRRVLPRA
jgi:DNA-binding response OmpR family regulator